LFENPVERNLFSIISSRLILSIWSSGMPAKYFFSHVDLPTAGGPINIKSFTSFSSSCSFKEVLEANLRCLELF